MELEFDTSDRPAVARRIIPPLPATLPPDHVLNPFRVVIDSREQAPYHFRGFRTDAAQKNRPLVVQTVIDGLPTGDYSIDGFEDRIAVERKSLADLYGTLGHGRERFERELTRLSALQVAAVVIEASWCDVKAGVNQSRLSPKSVMGSINSWEQRFRTVHWHFCGTRGNAEEKTFEVLKRFWKEFGET